MIWAFIASAIIAVVLERWDRKQMAVFCIDCSYSRCKDGVVARLVARIKNRSQP